ncbi:jg16165 [Pararge aegeria aegeria]|uniref:Jg16165 protein n=1 Tax=Pararge aegeria aegeria TaxID=348720 RepID=A0A8S4REL8_9NEOP|nr:jg16165 [Pararge aegeria aegeria]
MGNPSQSSIDGRSEYSSCYHTRTTPGRRLSSGVHWVPYQVKHFQVTTQVPYLTLGPIEAIGYHPSTLKSEHPSECEKIYQDHIEDLYSDETTDYSEESLEMAKMPMDPVDEVRKEIQDHLEDMYYMDK